jgi:hypothetical protein
MIHLITNKAQDLLVQNFVVNGKNIHLWILKHNQAKII